MFKNKQETSLSRQPNEPNCNVTWTWNRTKNCSEYTITHIWDCFIANMKSKSTLFTFLMKITCLIVNAILNTKLFGFTIKIL